MNEEVCDACNGRGWLICTMYGSEYVADGKLCILKCNTCEVFENDDEAAKASGLPFVIGDDPIDGYPVIRLSDVPDEMRAGYRESRVQT